MDMWPNTEVKTSQLAGNCDILVQLLCSLHAYYWLVNIAHEAARDKCVGGK